MKLAHECLASVKEDIKPLLEEHWKLVALNQGKIKLNPNWEEYARLDAAGKLLAFTAREDGELVGYCVLVVGKSIHYQDHINAIQFALCSRAASAGAVNLDAAEAQSKQRVYSISTLKFIFHSIRY